MHIQSLPSIFLLHGRSIQLVFLPGGQSDLQATEHLNAMNRLGQVRWELSFSFGRALQDAQPAFHHRAWCNNKARFRKYTAEMENDKAVA